MAAVQVRNDGLVLHQAARGWDGAVGVCVCVFPFKWCLYCESILLYISLLSTFIIHLENVYPDSVYPEDQVTQYPPILVCVV